MSKRIKKGGIKSQRDQDVMDLSEAQAREHIEKLLWPDGHPVCRHCGSVNAYKMQGATCRPGLCRCRDCEKQFTVTVGTIFEDSHISLSKWVRAIHMMTTSKKGASALQLMRNLGLGSYQSAWFMCHRIRLAMSRGPAAGLLKGTVQVDETYVGGKPRPGTGTHKRGRGTDKAPVMVLVEKDGSARSKHVEKLNLATLIATITETVDPSAAIHTDELPGYKGIASQFAGGHHSVNHRDGEYVGPNGETTNTAESYFALLKRGHYGVYHKMSKKHMHRYCAEFDFRWNGRKLNDVDRRDTAIVGAEGKRLMYQQPLD